MCEGDTSISGSDSTTGTDIEGYSSVLSLGTDWDWEDTSSDDDIPGSIHSEGEIHGGEDVRPILRRSYACFGRVRSDGMAIDFPEFDFGQVEVPSPMSVPEQIRTVDSGDNYIQLASGSVLYIGKRGIASDIHSQVDSRYRSQDS